MKRVVTVDITVDPEDYSEPDTNEAAMGIVAAMLRGDADMAETRTIERARPGEDPHLASENCVAGDTNKVSRTIEILGDDSCRQKMDKTFRYQNEPENPVYTVGFSGYMYIRGVRSEKEAKQAALDYLGFDRGGLTGGVVSQACGLDLANLQFAKTAAESKQSEKHGTED